jgi:hypothetical protein
MMTQLALAMEALQGRDALEATRFTTARPFLRERPNKPKGLDWTYEYTICGTLTPT